MNYDLVTSDFWISAYKLKLGQEGIPLYIQKKGHEVSGSIIIKLSLLDGSSKLFKRVLKIDGHRIWVSDHEGKECEIDKLILREIKRDPDLWVLAIEDKLGRHFLFDVGMDV